MSKLKNKNHEKFCYEYVEKGLNGTQAYLKANPSCKDEKSAKASASRLLTNVNVQNRIKELQIEMDKKAILTLQERQKILTDIATCIDEKTPISTDNRLKALDMLNKMAGAYTENINANVKHDNPLNGMTTEELKEYAESLK